MGVCDLMSDSSRILVGFESGALPASTGREVDRCHHPSTSMLPQRLPRRSDNDLTTIWQRSGNDLMTI